MKNLYATTAIVVILSATSAFAQTTTTLGGNTVTAGSGPESSIAGGSTGPGINGNAESTVAGESAVALADGAGGSASAAVGNPIIASSFGNGVGPSNIGSVGVVSGGPANRQVQFQLGNDNVAINTQIGNQQESATVQIGDDNTGFIAQTTAANEAALSQVGNNNNTALVQNGLDNAAAAATFGNNNSALGLQSGDLNMLAFAQIGDANSGVTFQSGLKNTASTLQIGNANTSYINQGGSTTAIAMTAVEGTAFTAGLPSPVVVSGSGLGALGATSNAAASIQMGNGHTSAILQSGTANEAVNFQSN